MNTSGYIAMTEQIAAAGKIIWWRLSGTLNIRKLRPAWAAAGLDEKLLPDPPAPSTALRRAAQGQAKGRRLVRPLEQRKGYALVDERAEGDDLDYDVECRVKLDAVCRLVVEPADHPLVPVLREAYNRHLDECEPADIGSWLVYLVGKVDGVPLRDTGGVYFIPSSRVAEWDRMTAAVRAASQHVVLGVPAMHSDQAVASILDAIEVEAGEEARKMEVELTEGKIGETARKNRISRCEAVEAKVARYEELLGCKLTKLTARLEELRADLCVATLQGTSFSDEQAQS